jgi:hypothetical protein
MNPVDVRNPTASATCATDFSGSRSRDRAASNRTSRRHAAMVSPVSATKARCSVLSPTCAEDAHWATVHPHAGSFTRARATCRASGLRGIVSIVGIGCAATAPALPRNRSTISAARYPGSRIGAMDAVKWCSSQSFHSSPGVKTCGASERPGPTGPTGPTGPAIPSATSSTAIRTGTTTAPGATTSVASFPGGIRTHCPAVSRSTVPQRTATVPVWHHSSRYRESEARVVRKGVRSSSTGQSGTTERHGTKHSLSS